MTQIQCTVAAWGPLLAVLAGAILPSHLLAQGQEKVHAGEGQERLILDKDWSKEGEELKTFQAYRQGNQSAAISPEILEHGAQWFAYRFTHEDYQKPKEPTGKK